MIKQDEKLPSYPKIYAIGHAGVDGIFEDEIIIEEKIDGSQFSFGVDEEGNYYAKSKRVQLPPTLPENDMFYVAVNRVAELSANLKPGYVYRGEFLRKPKHNALAYDRIPTKNIILFDINVEHSSRFLSYEEKKEEAERLGLEIVPLMFKGKVTSHEMFKGFLQQTSILGGVKPEGVVVKNYSRFGKDGKPLFAKFVSEEFKEVHRKDWKETHKTSKDILQILGEQYNSKARWMKAIQRLRDEGKLEHSPRDIGELMKEIPNDILEECKDEIQEALFKWAWPSIKRHSLRGFAQWYKELLVKDVFDDINKT